MARGDDLLESATTRFTEQLNPERIAAFFEPQLVAIGLGEDRIRTQTFEELQQSLERVNDALQNPSNFGTLKIMFTVETGIVVAKAASDYHVEVGILPVLLQRKKLILERLQALRGEQKIEALESIARDITDQNVRGKFEEEIRQLKAEMQELREQSSEVELTQMQAQIDAEIERAKAESELAAVQAQLDMEKFERRSKVWQSFLEREPAATLIGGVLLLLIACSLITSMFLNPVLLLLFAESQSLPIGSDILNNAFLLILGYFFGQTVGRAVAAQRQSEGSVQASRD